MAQRDYAAEYAARQRRAQSRGYTSYYKERISKGIAKGLTRSQAAGTPKVTELPASIKNTPSTHRNWIANAIKEINADVKESIQFGLKGDERLEQYQQIVKTYQEWKRSGWRNDNKRHELNNLIRDYKETYDDELDYKGGEGNTPR